MTRGGLKHRVDKAPICRVVFVEVFLRFKAIVDFEGMEPSNQVDGSSGSKETLAYSTRSLWSSETLVAGMDAVSNQPYGLLVKTEDDAEMVAQYKDP